MKPFCISLSIAIITGFSILARAQNHTLTLQEAQEVWKQAGQFPQPSYISPEQAAAMFHFNGELTVEEDDMYGDTTRVSHIRIKPKDGSFVVIVITVDYGTKQYDLIDALDKFALSRVKDTRDEVRVNYSEMPNGAKVINDGDSTIIAKSPDGRFSVEIEIELEASRRDPPEKTDSNRALVDGLTSNDFKFLSGVMTSLYPMAEKKYQDQMEARARIVEAQSLTARLDAEYRAKQDAKLREASQTNGSPNAIPAQAAPTPGDSHGSVESSNPKISRPNPVMLIALAVIVALGGGMIIYRFGKDRK